jgi:subtilisin family serine protease
MSRHWALLCLLLLGGCVTTRQNDVLIATTTQYSTEESRLIVVTVANQAAATTPRPGSSRRSYSGTGVYTASDAARSTMRAIASDYQLTELAAWPIAPLQVHCSVLQIPVSRTREEVLHQLREDQRVRLAQPMNSFVSRSQTYNDPYLDVQRGFKDINAAGAQQWSRGERVRVAVIDTGLDAAHPDFGGRIAIQRNFIDRDAARFGQDRHGTAVAGIISASANNSLGIVGIAPAVELLALKACWQLEAGNDAARCNSLTLAQALVAAMDEHAQVVNLSLTGPHDPLLDSLVAAGIARGIIYVGAAPYDADPAGFPGGTPGIIAVDSAETGRARDGVLRAPGREVVTLVPGGRYDFLSGSSLATAHVSGTVALLLAKSPHLSQPVIHGLLQRSERQNSVGALPYINACTALAELTKGARCE